MRTCGPCTACCTVIPVEQIGKPAASRCTHEMRLPELKIGCRIYATRPASCRTWSCVWHDNLSFPDALRPSICGVIFDPAPDLVRLNGKETAVAQAWILPGFEEAWKYNANVGGAIRAIVDAGLPVLLRYPPAVPGGPGRSQTAVKGPDGRLALTRVFEENEAFARGEPTAQRLARAARLVGDM